MVALDAQRVQSISEPQLFKRMNACGLLSYIGVQIEFLIFCIHPK